MDFRAEVDFTPDDAVAAYRIHSRHSPHAQKVLLAGAILLVGTFGFVAYRMDFLLIAFLGVMLGAILLVAYPLYEWRIRYETRKKKIGRQSVTLSEGGVRIWDAVVDYRHSWEMVTKARLDECGVLIYVGPQQYFFIPARSWVGGYRQDDLKMLFERVIKKPNQAPQPIRSGRGAAGPLG